MRQMITPDEARQIVLEQTRSIKTETVPHGKALGRVLATGIDSELELPPFDNSAMDGYALIAQDLQGATPDSPTPLRLLQTVGAGEVATHALEAGSCIKIMTGATIPEGTTAVVMREETREQDGQVLFSAPAKAGQNIRPRGTDVRLGEQVLAAGTRVRPAEWAMLASLGQSQVEVFCAPRVGIITTGEELVDVDAELLPGQIRDSNSFALEGLCEKIGCVVERKRVGDDVPSLHETILEMAMRCDCIVTSGGVSMGDFDPVRDVLLAMQESGEANIYFWKIAMKPGKPVMFATLSRSPMSHQPTPVFGLPGNPVSVMVAFEQFVRPALWKMQGRRSTPRVVVQARVLESYRSPEGKVEFVRASVHQDEGGQWHADVTGDQSSGRLSTMTRANALLVVAADVTQLAAGELVPAQLTDD